MSFIVKINGYPVECESAADALALVAAAPPINSAASSLNIQQTVQVERIGRGRPPLNGHTPQQAIGDLQAIRNTIAFLEEADTDNGVGASDLVRIFSLAHGRGIGGALTRVRRILSEHGFDPKLVYDSRGSKYAKRWYANTDGSKAVDKLRHEIEATAGEGH